MEFDPAVAHIYAEALLEAARQAGTTDQVFDQADAIYRCFRKDSRMRVFLENPRIPKEDKHKLIDSVFRDRVEPLLANLIHVMLRNNRISNLDETLRLVYELVEERRGIIPASVTTVVALTDEQRGRLQQALSSQLGLRFDVKYRVDPDVLGGVVFKYRDRLIDGSLRFDLQKLRERLMAVAIG